MLTTWFQPPIWGISCGPGPSTRWFQPTAYRRRRPSDPALQRCRDPAARQQRGSSARRLRRQSGATGETQAATKTTGGREPKGGDDEQ